MQNARTKIAVSELQLSLLPDDPTVRAIAPSIRRLLVLPAIATLSLAVVACGATSRNVHPGASTAAKATKIPTPSARPPGSYWKHDGDADDSEPPNKHAERDDALQLASYGPEAPPAQAHAIASLVKRYYAAAAMGDGATACSLLYSAFATQLGGGQDQPQRRDKTCAATVASMLAAQHQHLIADEVTAMVVIGARVKGNLGLAVLGFRHMPESTILVQREHRTWKIGELFDNELE